MQEVAIERLKTILERQGVKLDPSTTIETTQKATYVKMGDYTIVFSRKEKLTEKDFGTMLGGDGEYRPTGNIILVAMSKPSENVENAIRSLISSEGIRLYFHLKELQYDITQHRMFPPHFLFNEEFKKANPKVAEQYNQIRMKNSDELPPIDCLDIGARIVGARPGDIVYIRRHSDTVGYGMMFRRVVVDANIDK